MRGGREQVKGKLGKCNTRKIFSVLVHNIDVRLYHRFHFIDKEYGK